MVLHGWNYPYWVYITYDQWQKKCKFTMICCKLSIETTLRTWKILELTNKQSFSVILKVKANNSSKNGWSSKNIIGSNVLDLWMFFDSIQDGILGAA